MQQELTAMGLPVDVQLLGVNGIGHESGNVENCNGRTLPWLQDVANIDVWSLWAVSYRDVICVDENNELLFIYNLTTYNLALPVHYNALRDMLVDAATPAGP
jgi:hypothetical protein